MASLADLNYMEKVSLTLHSLQGYPRKKCSRQPKNTVKIKTMLSNGSRISRREGRHQKVETTKFLFGHFPPIMYEKNWT